MSTWSPEVYNKAWLFSTLAHSGQTYGGPEQGMRIDYINHIASVAMEVSWALAQTPGCNGDLAIQCALLHDVVEDTKFTYEDVNDRFGSEVADGVRALTKDATLASKENQMTDSLARIRQQPHEVWMVKMADRISNLYHPPFYWSNDKILAYRDEASVIYEALKEANRPLAQRLAQKIRDYHSFLK
jgi:(p)ppGpp synthase/HD superfamily hydrolase